MIIYSTGYSGPHHTERIRVPESKTLVRVEKWQAFAGMVERENLVVCDIRLNAWSMAPMWRKINLSKTLGGSRYVAIPELGNENYKLGGSFAIRDWQKGASLLASAAATTRRTPLLLCACEDHLSCHRSLVAKTLRDQGHTVIEISEWDESFALISDKPF